MADSIVGYEWWPHTRPVQANLGHNLHFDTDESLLAETGDITHPIVSSVLYLTGGADSGATIVFDQTPDSKDIAKHGWKYLYVLILKLDYQFKFFVKRNFPFYK